MFLYSLYRPWINNTLVIAAIAIKDGVRIENSYFYYRYIKEYKCLPYVARSEDSYKEWSLFTSMKLWNGKEWENAL